MPIINCFVIICFAVFFVAIIGFSNVILHREENGCTMTYMYEYPQYVRVSLNGNATKRYKTYNLYAYGEGRFTEKVREMKFTGIPVLFIHGHRGSYKQVRSLSSVSLRKALKSRSPFHFDYFSADLNEEYSGFYGGVLDRQTEFVRICVEKILTLYRDPGGPKSIVLIGHSMGGMIAKGLFVRDMDWSRVTTIVTLATPHRPAVLLDPSAASYYEEVTQLWDESDVSHNVTLVSIGGGSRDLVVHSGLTFSPHADISVVSSEVSGVWLTVDHVCISWCKELVLVLVRSLFDSVDLETNQISTDIQHRLNVFKYHLLERSGSKQYRVARGGFKQGKETVLYKGEGDKSSWLRLRKNQLTWKRTEKLSVNTHILIPISSQPADTLIVKTINHNAENWIFACKPDTPVNNIKICSKGEDLSWQGQIFPTKDYKRKMIVLNLVSLRMEGKTHVVVRTLPTSDLIEISFDLLVHSNRGMIGQPGYLVSQDLVQKTKPGELYRWVQLPQLLRPWQAYVIRVTPHPSNCSSFGSHSSVSVSVPWHHEGSHILLSENRRVVSITTYTPKPQKRDAKSVEVGIHLNPECSYSIRVEQSLTLVIGRLVLRSYPTLLAFLSVCLIMCLAKQIRCLGESATCPLLHLVAATAAKPYYVLPAANIAASIARYCYPVVPMTDVHHHSGLVETLLLPLLLHCSSVALLLIIASMVLIGVVFHGQAFNSIVLKFISKLCLGLPWISEWVLSGVSKLPVIVSGLMLAISYTACSSLAIYIGLVYYFIKLVSYYEDFWDEVVYWPLRAVRAAVMNRFGKRQMELKPLEIPVVRDISFHLSLFLIWAIIALITTPSVLSWAHNYKYSSCLEGDPFFPTGIVLSLCGGFLWQAETPRINLKWSGELSRGVLSSCVGVLVYCQTSLYRLQALLCVVLVSICAHQLVASADPLAEDKSDTLGTPSLLSAATTSFLKRLDQLLGNRSHLDKSNVSYEILDAPVRPDSLTEEEDLSKSDDDCAVISDHAELSAELSTDFSDRVELSADISAMFSDDPVEELSARFSDDPAEELSAASFDPSDRPVLSEEPVSTTQLRQPVLKQNTTSLSSNSSFENISITEMKD